MEKNALGEAWAGFVAGWGGGGVNGKAGAGGAGGDGGKGGKGGGVEEEEETTRLLRVLLGVYVGSGGERCVFLFSFSFFVFRSMGADLFIVIHFKHQLRRRTQTSAPTLTRARTY